MQYKIPLQIENEDEIVLWLSLRQIVIIAVYGGIAYTIFDKSRNSIWDTMALVLAIPVAVIGIVIALMRIYEMTFLPTVLNYLRLSLNGQQRQWSQWTDSYSDLDIWYLVTSTVVNKPIENKESFNKVINWNEEFQEHLKNL